MQVRYLADEEKKKASLPEGLNTLNAINITKRSARLNPIPHESLNALTHPL